MFLKYCFTLLVMFSNMNSWNVSSKLRALNERLKFCDRKEGKALFVLWFIEVS